MSRARVLASTVAILLCAFALSAGSTIWQYTRSASLATLRSPHDAALRFEIGNYYFGAGAYDLKKAEKYFRETLELDAEFQGSHYQLARVYFIRGDFYDALREINEEIQMYPDNKRSNYVRGLIYGYTGKLPKAEADFQEFLEWKPDSWAGHNDLAWIYFQRGKYQEAVDAAAEGLRIAPYNPWLLNSEGVSLLNIGDKKGARAAFERALMILESMSPEDWGRAYPGNDPNVYQTGFDSMKSAIQKNLQLLSNNVDNVSSVTGSVVF
ncbi:MAG: Tetratricopeptide TPR_1 repeat-containing protein [Parcubacteria group bacterium GW2011_GWA2_51_10]|nr:MAG: Tetratricopeptide TPR_1 repeat-containing protein [Parcubacteria group bacterium GW2011_GWA2_51_10]